MLVVGIEDPLNKMGTRENITVGSVFADASDAEIFPVFWVFEIFLETGMGVKSGLLLACSEDRKLADLLVGGKGAATMVLTIKIKGC